ncbi:DoxX family membrane protein [Actinotalea sp. K2]|uniref:DoxX family membrane protein n=1 Tax=Actinotalea sp. K2 TaxID=2939438 RepID=UPI0020174B7C|nr:DoxX family membrane protein [Actinotalea sp. K2]MCL3862653.1 DoxX family membrane protein [Actinotalea sp. K2]
MLVRRIARPLFAAWFVAEGIDALRRPRPHVERTEPVLRDLGTVLELPHALTDRSRLTLLVRLHGAIMLKAAVMLAIGRKPRTAALTLAALTVPLVVVNQPFGPVLRRRSVEGGTTVRSRFSRPIGATGGVSTRSVRAVGTEDTPGVDRAEQRERWLRNLTMLGGALLAGIDTEARPGIAWRVGHARVDRAVAREAKGALALAGKQAQAAARTARGLAH